MRGVQEAYKLELVEPFQSLSIRFTVYSYLIIHAELRMPTRGSLPNKVSDLLKNKLMGFARKLTGHL